MYSTLMTEPMSGLENVAPFCWLQQVVDISTTGGYEVTGRLMGMEMDGPDIRSLMVHVSNEMLDVPVWVNGRNIVTIAPFVQVPDEEDEDNSLEEKLNQLQTVPVELVQMDGTDFEDEDAEDLELDDDQS